MDKKKNKLRSLNIFYSVYKIDVVLLVGYIRFFHEYMFHVCVGALGSCSPGPIHEDY